MSSFAQFYQDGGLFMHVVSLTALASTFFVAKSALMVRKSEPRAVEPRIDPTLRLATHLAWLTLPIGLLGTMFGMMEVAGALLRAPEPVALKHIAQGLAISLNTSAWATMVAISLLFAAVVTRYRHGRKQAPAA